MNNDVTDFSEFENFQCRVWFYQVGHSEMFIQLSSNDEFTSDKTVNHSYLIFTDVIYFSGPFE